MIFMRLLLTSKDHTGTVLQWFFLTLSSCRNGTVPPCLDPSALTLEAASF